MPFEPVDVFLEDMASDALLAVLVRVYDDTGSYRYTEGQTDEEGRVSFLLASENTYSLRFYKFGYTFKQPQVLEVLSDPTTEGVTPNNFTVKGQGINHVAAADPRFCRASGYFRDGAGLPRSALAIHIIADFRPAIVDGTLIQDERVILHTDEKGFACTDLLRCACYTVTLGDLENNTRTIRVPDAPYVNLPDLLFPVVARVSLGPFELAVGSEVLTAGDLAFDTAGTPLPGTGRDDVIWCIEDPDVATLDVGVNALTIRGVAPGTTRITAKRKDQSIVRIPDPGILGQPIEVVVTE